MTTEFNVNINWLAIPHQQLYDEIHNGPGVAGAGGTERAYRQMQQRLVDIRVQLEQGLKALGGSWQGIAANAAADSIDRFSPWAGHAGEASTNRNSATTQQMDHYARAKNNMPEPKPAAPMPDNNAIKVLSSFFTISVDRQVQEIAAQQAHLRAVEVMKTYTSSSSGSVSGFTPYDPPPQITVDVPGAPAPPPRPPIDGAPPPPRFRGGNTNTTYPGEQRVDGVPVQDNRQGEHERGQVEQQHLQPTPNTPPIPGHNPTPQNPVPVHNGGGTIGGGGVPMRGNSFGGAGGLSGGTGGGYGRAGAVGGIGGSRDIAPGTRSTPGTGAGRGVASAKGGMGKPGQSFLQPALAQSQREEDSEHTRKYSIVEDIVGELPLVAPAVIGEYTDDR